MLHIDFYLIEDLFVRSIIEYKQYVQNIQIYPSITNSRGVGSFSIEVGDFFESPHSYLIN
jgi:hypothetical protein